MRKIDVFISWVAEFILPLSLVDRVYIFGSALKDANAANDLDTIIVFNEILVRDTCVRLRRSFSELFGIPLHIQIFHLSEKQELNEFLHVTDIHRRVF